MTLGVRLRLVGELVLDGGELVVGEARDIAGEAGEARVLDRLQADRAGDVEPARRRAVEEARVERELDRLARIDEALLRMEGEIEPLGNIVLEQELDLADRFALRVGVGLNRPLSGGRARQERNGECAPAHALVGKGRALVLDPVRPLDHQRQRQAGLGDALGVAQQRRREHGLARTVDPTLGIEEGVEPGGRVAAADAAVGEVEGVLRQVEEIVVVAERRDQKPRRRAALAARQARVEIDPAVRAGRLGRQHLVVARDELELDARERAGRTERLDERVDAVVAGHRGQAEVGDDHPLRRELHGLGLVGIVGLLLPRPRGDEIDAGLERPDGLQHRKLRHHVLVELARDVHRAAPNLDAVRVLDVCRARRVDRFEEIVAADGRDAGCGRRCGRRRSRLSAC